MLVLLKIISLFQINKVTVLCLNNRDLYSTNLYLVSVSGTRPSCVYTLIHPFFTYSPFQLTRSVLFI